MSSGGLEQADVDGETVAIGRSPEKEATTLGLFTGIDQMHRYVRSARRCATTASESVMAGVTLLTEKRTFIESHC